MLIGENGYQASIAGVKIEVILGGNIKVWLLKNKRHSHYAFPEINAGLTVCAYHGDMVYALCLNFLHDFSYVIGKLKVSLPKITQTRGLRYARYANLEWWFRCER